MNDSTPAVPRSGLARHLPRKPWQLVLIALLGLFVSGVIAAALVALLLTPTLPAVDALVDSHLKVPLRVYSAEGTLIAEFGEEKRIPVKIADVPDALIKAILAAEDDSFYYHSGVDFQGILRAVLNNLRAGGRTEGASTITMQVARNYFLSPEKTYTRKVKEILLAFKLERELSKDQILELYINKIFLGYRAYGFAAAAQVYYGRDLNQLTLPEMAMLAALPKAPSRNNPLSNPDSAVQRRNYVLGRMLKLNFIDEPTYTAAINTPSTASRHTARFSLEAPYVAEMVRQYMFETYAEETYGQGYNVYTTIRAANQQAAEQGLRRGILEYDRRHGYRGPAGSERIDARTEPGQLEDILKDYNIVGGLMPAIVTRVDEKSFVAYTQYGVSVEVGWAGMSWASAYISEDAQGPSPKKAADVVKVGHIVYLEQTGDNDWKLAQIPQAAGALVSLNPNDGAILALVGGFDFYQSKFNRVIQAERQPGSNIKPFIYSAALEKGFTAASLVSGAPIVVEDVSLEDEWRPEDYSREFFGPTRLRKALTLSLNLVAIRLLRAITPEYAVEYLPRFGFDPAKMPRNLSLALGTASATPLQMATAFAVFANGGYRVEPYFITRIEDADHKVLEQASPTVVCPSCPQPVSVAAAIPMATPNPAPGAPGGPAAAGAAAAAAPAPRVAPRVITAENAFIMTSMMRDVVQAGTATGAKVLGRNDLAGKTGTTNDHRDAWFSGFNNAVVATAWVGFDQPLPLGRGEVGGRAALPIWVDYMRVALQGVPEQKLVQPPGIVTAYINRDSGRPTAADDPDGMYEYFIKGAPEQRNEDGSPGPGGPPTPGGVPQAAPAENVREGLF